MGNCCCKKHNPKKVENVDIDENANKAKKTSFGGWANWAKKYGGKEDESAKDLHLGKKDNKKKRNEMRGSRMGTPIEPKVEPKTYTVVMLRHGESEANKAGICSGWLDAPLTEKGVKQAMTAGEALRTSNYQFDIAYTSMLCRAQLTCDTALEGIGQLGNIPIVKTWRLNEAHYGGMTGLGTQEALDKYGNETLQRWASTFNVKPPEIKPDNPCYIDIVDNEMYADIPIEEFPMCESLEDCMMRALVFWKKVLVPDIMSGKRILIVAHEDVLRGLMKHLNRQTDEAIMTLHLPNSIPFVYTLNAKMKPTQVIKFLGSDSVIANAYTYAHGYTDPRQSRGRAHPLDAPNQSKKAYNNEAAKKKVRIEFNQSRIGQTFDNTSSRQGSRLGSRVPAPRGSRMARKKI